MMLQFFLLAAVALQSPPSSPVQAPVPGPTAAAAAEQLAAAEARYRAAIALTPTIGAYHESLARVLERQGRKSEALAVHAEAVRLDSMSPRARAGYGALLLELGRAGEAVPHLEAAARLDPMNVEVRTRLAAALSSAGERGIAATVLREAQALAPEDSGIARALAAVTTSTAPAGRHDLSGFADDDVPRWSVRRVAEWIFAAVLGACGLALLGPLVGIGALLVRQVPVAIAGLARRG